MSKMLYATHDGGIISFPAFVCLPASARPDSTHLLSADGASCVKFITLHATLKSNTVPVESLVPFKQQIAARWNIPTHHIFAIVVDLEGERVLIETTEDWEEWINVFFHKSASSRANRYNDDCYSSDKNESSITPIHIDIIVHPSRDTGGATQRQSLFQGMFDELSRLRSQQTTSSAHLHRSAAALAAMDRGSNEQAVEGTMSNELGQAFAEMLALQRSATATSTATTAPVPAESEDESLTIVSTHSTSSLRSSRSPSRSSRSPSRSRSRSGRSSLLLTSTLTLITIFTLLLCIITPASASISPLSLSTHNLSLSPRDSPVPVPVTPRQNSRHLHLCKCTCFQTNSTLVPLYSPLDPAKPCLTCTRQFCLDQGLDMCKGAKLEHTDHDVGTGLEGDVWAKCFQRDSYKDQSIITLYLLVLVALVAFSAMRGRVQEWYQQYQTLGPQGLYQAVRQSPWRRSSR